MPLVNLSEILEMAEHGGFSVPAFNVYNMETVMGVKAAAEAADAPVIFQIYSRLFDKENGCYVAALIRQAAAEMKVPVALHLDHGATETQVQRALRYGASGIMIDASSNPFDENVRITKRVVSLAAPTNVPVEGELGHVGSTKDRECSEFTDVNEAAQFVKETGVAALAVMVGTAHGRYKKAPVLDIDRIAAIRRACGVPIVLHGGSGVPDGQIRAAIKAGVRKINFSTDLCYAFLDTVFDTSRELVGIDLFMADAIDAVARFAAEKITLLGAGK